jgi:hypothetical protein
MTCTEQVSTNIQVSKPRENENDAENDERQEQDVPRNVPTQSPSQLRSIGFPSLHAEMRRKEPSSSLYTRIEAGEMSFCLEKRSGGEEGMGLTCLRIEDALLDGYDRYREEVGSFLKTLFGLV